ncbi:MAG: helix-turn-helix transcriptional regulator [Sterolibacterium sp.]|nr:helix-turn-helix transcriptional regulator [Sterolibacterium sp.]
MVTKKKIGNQLKVSESRQPVEAPEDAPPPKTADGLAIRIRIARERKGLSLSKLHEQSGISKTALHDYESGRTKPGARELKILCELLEITPNLMIFGTEEPLKPREGLRSLVKLRSGPAMFVAAMFLIPIIAASLDEDQIESLLVLVASLLEARDKETYRNVSAIAEVVAEQFGTGSPAEIAALSQKVNDPVFMAELQAKVLARVKK